MSGISLIENRLIQRVRDSQEELGYIKLDQASNKYVLWLKDTFGVAGTAGSYVRADEFPSLETARSIVLEVPSVFIWHCIWMRGALKREAEKELRDQWSQLSAGGVDSNKQNLIDRLLAYVDRLPFDEAKKLVRYIGLVAFSQAITEIVKKILNGG